MPRESLIVYIDSRDKRTLKQAAKAEDRSLSNYAGRILEEHARVATQKRGSKRSA